MRITVKARGKLNLSLNVEGMFDATYHRLSSVVTTVDVFDQVSVSPRNDDQVIVTVDGLADNYNVANKVARAIVQKKNVQGVDVSVKKGIAIMGGMGGSSVDAAATMQAMALLYNLPFDEEMIKIAVTYGSDIAYLIRGGLCLATGKGDDILFVATDKVFNFVVINGPRLSTTQVFEQYDISPDKTHFDNEALLNALNNGDIALARKHLGNNLQLAAVRLAPEIATILQTCTRLQIPTPVMTGSGGNLFILCKTALEAKKFSDRLKKEGLDCYTTQSTQTGMEVDTQ